MPTKLKILDVTILRTPAFGLQDELPQKWPALKELIGEASPDFFQIIRELSPGDLETVDTKTSYTIWKYFNRARYRATPFGRFGAITVLFAGSRPGPLIIADEMITQDFVDWNEKVDYDNDFQELLERSGWFQVNTTLYLVGGQYRYVRMKEGVFEVASAACFPELDTVISLCREKVTKTQLYHILHKEHGLTPAAIDTLLLQMLSLQLLLTERCANITGEDYFKRIGISLPSHGKKYTIAERNALSGSLEHNRFRDIPELISFLNQHLPSTENPALMDFRLAFQRKFENRAVPLTLVMDPETGIGYNDLGTHPQYHPLEEILDSTARDAQSARPILYTALHRFLLNKLILGGPVCLEDFVENQVSVIPSLPNSFSVLLRMLENGAVIQNAGGCTTNTLLGRFTIAHPELENQGRMIAALEARANPDVLFFDVAYQAEKGVDNVNRRKRLYPYELPILSWSCDPSALHLDDILVAVRDAAVVLWSKKHQKRLIPRVPSAYNYTRSDLAVFRFLCDLQHQQIRSDLNFKWSDFFPDLNHYPRVSFKSLVISPAQWLLPPDILQMTRTGDIRSGKTTLLSWFQRTNIHFPFKTGHADQVLCFDPARETDIEAFLYYCRQHAHEYLYISEALITEECGAHDTSGKKFASEILMNYSHEEQVYLPVNVTADERYDRYSEHVISPGGEWLYFEIYCHPVRTDGVLTDQVAALLKTYRSKIRKWFFIRYDDPRSHIRLRIHLKDMAAGYPVISALSDLLGPDRMNGRLADLQLKTYFRETSRYGNARMELMEQYFFMDSKFVLKLLKQAKDTTYLYTVSLEMMQSLLGFAVMDIDEQVFFSRAMADRFAKEVSMDRAAFKQLNRSFGELQIGTVSHAAFKMPVQLKKAITAIITSAGNRDVIQKLLTDMIHMHINRLFNTAQRTHEAVLYQYLAKLLMKRRALSVFPAECEGEP